MKRTRRHIFLHALTALLLLLAAGVMCLQLPSVQTFISKKLVDRLETSFGGDVEVGRVSVDPLGTIILKDVILLDPSPMHDAHFPVQDTVARIGSLSANFDIAKLLRRKPGEPIDLKRVVIRDSQVNLVVEGKNRYGVNILNIKRIFNPDSERKKLEDKGNIFHVHHFTGERIGCNVINAPKADMIGTKGSDMFDPLYISLSGIGTRIRNVAFKDGIISGCVDALEFTDKSGWHLEDVSGEARIGYGSTTVDDLHIRDSWSDVRMESFSMTYQDSQSFKQFADEVSFHAAFGESHLGTQTLSHIVPSFRTVPLEFDIKSGRMEGPVSGFTVSGLDLREVSGISLKGTVSLQNITDPALSSISARIDRLGATTTSVQRTLAKVGKKVSIDNYARGTFFTFKGNVSGTPDDLQAGGTISSLIGSATADLHVTGLADSLSPVVIEGPVTSRDLDIGRILGNDLVHECTMRTGGRVTIGDEVSARIDSLAIDRLSVHGYDYSALAANGSFEENAFNGKLICSDPNLNFIFQGIVNLSRQKANAVYKFYFNLGYADLAALQIDNRGTTSRIAMSIGANYMRIVRGDLIGEVDIKNITVEDDTGWRDIGDVSIKSHSNENIHRGAIDAPFADATFVGNKPLTSIVRDVLTRFESSTKPRETGRYRVNCTFHDSRDLMSFIKPGLYIADGSSASFEMDAGGALEAKVTSPRIAIDDKFLKDFDASVESRGDTLYFAAGSQQLTAGASGILHKDGGRLRGNTLDAFLFRRGQTWRLSPCGFDLSRKDFSIDGLEISSERQRISVDGGWSSQDTDTLRIGIDDVDFSNIASLLGIRTPVKGILNGGATLCSPSNTGLAVSLVASGTSVSDRELGVVNINGAWNEESGRYGFSLRNNISGMSSIIAHGSLDPVEQDLSARVSLDRLDVGYASSFMKSIFSVMEGNISGEIALAGHLDALSIFSRDCTLENGTLQVGVTGVPYSVEGPFHLNDQGLYFDDMTIRDSGHGKGTVSGGITFDHLHEFAMNTAISFSRMKSIDIPSDDSSIPFYGNASSTGTVRLSGPMRSLKMDIDAATNGNGTIHIPLNAASAGTSSEIITFKKDTLIVEDPYEDMLRSLKDRRHRQSGLDMDIKLAVDEDTECLLEIDRASGNVISGRGDGDLKMNINGGRFSINGDYTLSSGNYHFAALGITNKDFDIKSGSSIKFGGNIIESVLDIDAVYTTKTSLGNLIADTTSVSSRRLVECGINISDRLKNPKLAFSINVPDLDPSTKSLVESALNTEDKVQKQFLSLLVANSFIPDEQSGIVNNTNLLYSNVASIMAGQLNNILERLDIPLDLGLTYQSNERSGTELFDVAVSTQLFNNRVSVGGVIGNRQYGTSSSNSNEEVVGDLDIEVKLNRSGSFRASLFSHSADMYTNYLDNSQRNGVGLAYQKEFNSLREFFRNIFHRRSDKTPAPSENVVINIE